MYGGGMAQGMQARSSPSVVATFDSGLLEQLGERVRGGAPGQGRPVAVGEEGRSRALGKGAFCSLGGIGLQRVGKLPADGNQASLVELGVTYGQQRIGQVHIVEGQPLGLAESQPRAVEKLEQCPQGIGVGLDRTLPTDIDGVEQALQLVTGVNVRWGHPRSSRLFIARRKRRPNHVAAADRVAVEAGQDAVLAGPVLGERTFTGKEVENVGWGDGIAADAPADLLQEPVQQVGAGVELGAMGLTPGDIVVDRIPEHHVRPSRSISATSRRLLSCTLAYTAVDEVLRWPR